MARMTVRMPIPDDPSEAIALLVSVKKRHTELGEASPLAALEWDEIDPALATAATEDALSDKCYRDAEKATRERNVQMPAVGAALRAVRDVLLGTYRSNPKKAGDFGIKVNDSPRSNAGGDTSGGATGADGSATGGPAQPTPAK